MIDEKLIKIEQMQPEDICAIANLWSKLAYNQYSRDAYYLKDTKHLLTLDRSKYYESCLNRSDCFIFVARYKSTIVGFVEMWFYKKDFFFNISDYAYILHLFVDTEIKTNVQPLYVPYSLCKVCEKMAIKHGYKYIEGDVFEFNGQMKTLLKLLKFKPYRIRFIKELHS